MPVEVILPKVDMDMETGRISRWHVAEGAEVREGDVLFEIETNKAAMEIEAPASGVLRDVVGREGIDIAVGKTVAWIYRPGEAAPAGAAPASSAAQPPAALPPDTGPATGPRPVAGLGTVPPAGKGRASPLARRLARAAGLDLAAVAGSGPHGRVLRADIEAALAAARTGVPAPAAAPASPPAGPPAPAASHAYDLIPHDGMRRTIARRLVEAKLTVPHFYLTLDCRIDRLVQLRAEINAAAPVATREGGEAPAYRVSVNDMVIKALAVALRVVPDANVTWTEAGLRRHHHVDVGVAVSIPGGLLTPIVRGAESKSLSVIASEVRDLAARARGRRLRPEEYEGGTTAVSNLGMFGVREFAAIINPPHATILAVGAGELRPVVEDGALGLGQVMTVTLSADHRAIDGALAAELAAAFRQTIEQPLRLLV